MGELGKAWRHQGGQVVDATRVKNLSRKGDKRVQLKYDQVQAHKVHI